MSSPETKAVLINVVEPVLNFSAETVLALNFMVFEFPFLIVPRFNPPPITSPPQLMPSMVVLPSIIEIFLLMIVY